MILVHLGEHLQLRAVAQVLLALWDEASAPALPAERVWAPVIYPRGPKCTSGFAHGKGQPPRGFLSLNCLRQLRPEDTRAFTPYTLLQGHTIRVLSGS